MFVDIPITGDGWSVLVPRVDALVTGLMRAKNLPGMTVAVTRHGRLILSRGYGHANTETMAVMRPDSRSRIGSVTKATVTGPAGFQLMREKNIDPATTRLYGPGGLFGQSYDSDIRVGVERFTPLAAVAFGPGDRVFAWYTNGTFSVGDTRVLDAHAGPSPYALPAGKTPASVRSISFSPDGRTHAWYDDGTHSLGTPADLGAVTQAGEKEAQVVLPRGYSILDVVGVGVAGSGDLVYVWYDDGTFSAGTAMDFAAASAPRPFQVARGSGGAAQDIRDVDIDGCDRVHAWFRNGTTSAGTAEDLARHRAPRKYALPTFAPGAAPDDWYAWYMRITIQHLLDHRAGFERSGDVAGAVRQFGQEEPRLTYEHTHQRFLQTRKLLFEPGTATRYSNHGFGMWTLLIPAMTNHALSFLDHVQRDYLRPMGLDDDVVPMSTAVDGRDAWGHRCDGDVCVPIAFESSTLGLAAGGFTASAESLARIMVELAGRYTHAELDSMGWGANERGKLSHSGLIEGGASHVAMFPAGYRSAAGPDVGGIHVAVNANAGHGVAELSELAAEIAVAVAASEVPADYDLWAPGLDC